MESVTAQEALQTIGANVRRLRTDAHMTQVSLADAVGVSQATISQVEKGSKDFTIGLITEIATALGEPVDLLLRTEKIKPTRLTE